MILANLLEGVEVIREFQGREELNPQTALHCLVNSYEVKEVTVDSRQATKGSLFIAVRGNNADGGKYIRDAIERGARYIVCEYIPEDEETALKENRRELITYIVVRNCRVAETVIAANLYRHPSEYINLIGVTGTNGKTSIATLLYNTFRAFGFKCGLISTIANYIDGERFETINTTPGPLELNRLIGRMVGQGCQFCFMEVSSHAIDQGRIAELKYKGGIFTNLTLDHLDYHKTFENYRNCKKKFFDSLSPDAFALTNIDDPNGEFMVHSTRAQVHTYSCKKPADFKARIIEQSIEGMTLNINGTQLKCNFIGEYNAENLTAIYGTAVLLGAPHDQLVKIMETLHSVAGRLEHIKGRDNVVAAVDYAHTPDALENVLKTLQCLKPQGDLICVFGCGGDRDKSKRPIMGKIAGEYADKIYVTSDNPRTENPLVIIDDIREGMSQSVRDKSKFIPDRTEAITLAIKEARPGSIVLVAGKGHENYQIIGTTKHHLDDKEIVKAAFELKYQN